MSLFSRLLDALGVQTYIKLQGKSFAELAPSEVATMIDAFLEGGNSAFEENALYEFLLMRYRRPFLREAREKIGAIQEKYRTALKPDGLASGPGRAELMSLAQEFRHSDP